MAQGMSEQMAGAIQTQVSVTPMQDLIAALGNREKELEAYLRSLAEDQRNLMTRLEEIKKQQEISEAHLMRVQRAKAVLRNDEEPEKPTRYTGGLPPTIRDDELAPTLLPGVRFTGRDTAYGSDIRIGENEG